ncbi:hypothetical protein PF004_g1026 [Phytophthora fragariae]|uniref:Uncharacterized protein n=1 Tax=Phytophthora fragariae TaxID=53985 RepID=A0A6G0PTJ4_9STRA|nr:hypothetical protein PF004_g1026 [Phytophthora fragariae]
MSKKKALTQTKLSGKQPARSKKAKKGVKFLVKHIPIYGLKIGTRNALTSEIETVACRFCSVFGREKSTTGSKAPIGTTKFFICFRTDLYEKHMAGQHPSKWSSNKGVHSSEERESFFRKLKSHTSTD